MIEMKIADIENRLKDFLSDWNKPIFNEKIYLDLCKTVYDYLNADKSNIEERKNILALSRYNYLHYCEMMRKKNKDEVNG